jgi:hypothetical protein
VSNTQIFISHIHEDEVAATGLEEFLRAKLPSVADGIFVSSNHLMVGDDWLQKIKSALQSCKIVSLHRECQDGGRREVRDR